jgi:hypothetical protein
MSDEERAAEEEKESRRPRVVDKRISSRPPSGTPPAEPPSEPEPVVADVPQEPPPPPPGDAPPPEQPAAGEPGVWTPQQEEEARRIAEEIVKTPGLEWVVNTAVTLANVSATKLEFGNPTDAQVTIDALAALLNGVGARLEDAEAPLKQTLAQLQLAYTQRMSAPPTQG